MLSFSSSSSLPVRKRRRRKEGIQSTSPSLFISFFLFPICKTFLTSPDEYGIQVTLPHQDETLAGTLELEKKKRKRVWIIRPDGETARMNLLDLHI